MLKIGSFRLKPARGRQPAEFIFEGNAGRARLQVQISSLGSGRFSFSAHAEHARVRRTASPLPFALAVGNDAGTIAARIERAGGEHRDGDDDDRDGHGHDE